LARRRQNLTEDLIEITSKLPWWVGVALAIAAYIGLHSVATSEVTAVAQSGRMDALVTQNLFKTLASVGQYLLPLVFLVGAAMSVFGRNKRRALHATPGGSPACPVCQSAMVRRTAKRGANSGNEFWGCSQYPGCKGTRPV
jgi:restriction system protein